MGKKSRAKAVGRKAGIPSPQPKPPGQKPEDLIGKSFAVTLTIQSLEQLGRANLPGELGRKLKARFLDISCNHKTAIPAVTAHFVLEPDMATWKAPPKPEPPPAQNVKEGEEGKKTKKEKEKDGPEKEG